MAKHFGVVDCLCVFFVNWVHFSCAFLWTGFFWRVKPGPNCMTGCALMGAHLKWNIDLGVPGIISGQIEWLKQIRQIHHRFRLGCAHQGNFIPERIIPTTKIRDKNGKKTALHAKMRSRKDMTGRMEMMHLWVGCLASIQQTKQWEFQKENGNLEKDWWQE